MQFDEKSQFSLLFNEASNALAKRDYELVEKKAGKICKLATFKAIGYALMVVVYNAAGNAENIRRFQQKIKQHLRKKNREIIEICELFMRWREYCAAAELVKFGSDFARHDIQAAFYYAQYYSRLGKHRQANELLTLAHQGAPSDQEVCSRLADSHVALGRISEAKKLYLDLLNRFPKNQKVHWELAKLETHGSDKHILQMKDILQGSGIPDREAVYLHYAIAKELEDLCQWEESFKHYLQAGRCAKLSGNYSVDADIEFLQTITQYCNHDYVFSADAPKPLIDEPTPIFIVGLPRSGTTLLDRILSCHSQIESIDESFFFQVALQLEAGEAPKQMPSKAVIEKAISVDPARIAQSYLKFIRHRRGEKRYFIEKLPENFLYLGYIKRAFPKAKIIFVNRQKEDVCFALFKQPYFRFAYDLDDLGRYYQAHNHLLLHWRSVLGDSMLEVDYEALVGTPEKTIKTLFTSLGIDYEEACLRHDANQSPSTSASSVQIRSPIHQNSVGKWKHFEQGLAPLFQYLS